MAEFRQWREVNRVLLKDVVPLETPYNVSMELSSFCNFKCIYCAHSKPDHGQYLGNMSNEMIYKIVEDLKEFPTKIKKINLFGFGESLCNPNFPQILGIINKSGLAEAVEFTTNGLLLTKDRIDAILDNGGIDTIRISLQGLSGEAYKKICGVNIDFDEFISNLSYLYKKKGKMKLRMKIADIAIQDETDGRQKYEELFGNIADSIYVEQILPIYEGMDYDAINPNINKNSLNGRMNIHQDKQNLVCHRAFYRMRIRANGDVTAACCDATNDVKYGNVYQDSLYNIWNGNVHKSFLRLLLEGRRFEHPMCKDCVMPNDITSEADILDPWAEEILKRI